MCLHTYPSATDIALLFEHDEGNARFAKLDCSAQAGEARAHDDNLRRRGHPCHLGVCVAVHVCALVRAIFLGTSPDRRYTVLCTFTTVTKSKNSRHGLSPFTRQCIRRNAVKVRQRWAVTRGPVFSNHKDPKIEINDYYMVPPARGPRATGPCGHVATERKMSDA